MGQEHEGRRQAALVLVEMMLGDPGRIEAMGFGVADLLGDQPVAFGGRGLVKKPAEEAQALVRRAGQRGVSCHVLKAG